MYIFVYMRSRNPQFSKPFIHLARPYTLLINDSSLQIHELVLEVAIVWIRNDVILPPAIFIQCRHTTHVILVTFNDVLTLNHSRSRAPAVNHGRLGEGRPRQCAVATNRISGQRDFRKFGDVIEGAHVDRCQLVVVHVKSLQAGHVEEERVRERPQMVVVEVEPAQVRQSEEGSRFQAGDFRLFDPELRECGER